MNRLGLSEMLLNGLVEGQPNEEVISHIENIVIKIDNYLPLIVNKNENTLIEKVFNNNDLAQTIRDISNKEYYLAITRLDDYLLREKSYDLPLSSYELYIVKSILDGIVLSSN